MAHKLKILFFIICILLSCQKREWNNPFDPECPKEIFTPTGFSARQEGNQIVLSWTQNNSNITEFRIELKVDNGSFTLIATPGKSEVSVTYTISSSGKLNTFKLYAIAGSNTSNEVTTSITPLSKPNAAFVASKTSANTDETIQFTDQSTNNPTSWSWNFGDGLTSTLQNPTHSYSAPGTYSVSLTATNTWGSDTETKISYITIIATGNFTDSRDSKTYKTVKIGDRWWMAENLAYLPAVYPPSSESDTEPRYYVYGYQGTDTAAAKQHENYATYGVLYNWPAAMAGASSSSTNPSGVQGICPSGWHLPSDSEWQKLEDYLITNGYNYDGTTTGNKIAKSLAAKTHWNTSSNTGAIGNNLSSNNNSGFSALPGGYHGEYGYFHGIGAGGLWWSSTAYDSDLAWSQTLYYGNSNFYRGISSKDFGFSVRCVRD